MYVAWENLHGLRKWFLKAEAIENGFKRANNLGFKSFGEVGCASCAGGECPHLSGLREWG